MQMQHVKDTPFYDFSIKEASGGQKYLSCKLCTGDSLPPGTGHIQIKDIPDFDTVQRNFRPFRTFKNTVKLHILSKTHFNKLSSHNAEIGLNDNHKSRVHKIGDKLSVIAYNVIWKGRPFSDFSDWVSALSSADVDLGNINHSGHFFDRYMHSICVCLKERVNNFFNTKLKCSNQLPALCWKPDKYSKNGVSYQAVIIRHLCLKQGHLFRETYVGHSPVLEGSGMSTLTELTGTDFPDSSSQRTVCSSGYFCWNWC